MLDAQRPRGLLEVVDRLTFLQLDPTAVIAPAADLVLWSRLGSAYERAELTAALERDRTLFEHTAQPTPVEAPIVMIRPMADLKLFLAEMPEMPPPRFGRARAYLKTNDAFRRRILDHLREAGPLASREIPDEPEATWQSSGWTQERNVTQMLELLMWRGEVAVSARRGRERLWDLPERVFPHDAKPMPIDEAKRQRDERWLRALGIARPKFVGDAGIPVEVDGTSKVWRLDPDATADGFEGRTAILSPFDRLTHDRARALDLFGFDYTLEMYKPKEKRRWGYFALPVLHGDGLVGKIDATADRAAGALRVDAIHEDVPFTPEMRAGVEGELDALARWLGLDRTR
ncbi:MAG TPA: crosslink repair DNA glycosylase YcaQ family protein [Candidatus Limnocylindrales bacterium]|nr:crosslink repair DNA glycosylase YcaQ family protein [Candidatus Limnocylindrales bacterium]